jgi:hypothetical protein
MAPLARAVEELIGHPLRDDGLILRTVPHHYGAYVTNGMMAIQVFEANYRAFGYEPDLDNLPK